MATVERVEEKRNRMEKSEIDTGGLYRWLFLYSLPCHLGRENVFQKLICSRNFKPLKYLEDLSRNSVLKYFSGPHNKESFQRAQEEGSQSSPVQFYNHMLIPYILEGSDLSIRAAEEFLAGYRGIPASLISASLSKRQRKRMRDYDIADPESLKTGDIIYIHSGWVVDADKNED